MVEFRDYQTSDFTQVMQLWQATDMGGKERGDDHEQIVKTTQAGGKLIVMLLEGEIIGTSWITDDKRRLYLHHFGVLPEYQSMGYGHELMRETLRFVKQKNRQVKLEVHESNKAAIHLYEKFGFYRFGDYDSMIIRRPDTIDLS